MQDSWKRGKINQIAMLLNGALKAENMVGIKMNVPKEKLDEIVQILPSLNAPTIAGLYNMTWVSVESVVEEAVVREIIPKLINAGADGIIEYSLNKIVSKEDAFL